MSTVLDEETTTVVLEELDFEVTCEVVGSVTGTCPEHADYQMQCVGCGAFCGLLCISHAIFARTSDRPVRHRDCGLSGPLRDIVTVVAL